MGYLKLGTINNLCNDQKEKSVNQQKEQKLLKIQTGGRKIEKLQKLEKLKNRTKNDCHKYKLEARRAMRYHADLTHISNYVISSVARQ